VLNTDTKRNIDNLRDILVGKIPTPTGQVEQITLALIYKFMSDIDKGNIDLFGGKSFFENGYKEYSWRHIMDQEVSAHERVKLYSEGL